MTENKPLAAASMNSVRARFAPTPPSAADALSDSAPSVIRAGQSLRYESRSLSLAVRLNTASATLAAHSDWVMVFVYSNSVAAAHVAGERAHDLANAIADNPVKTLNGLTGAWVLFWFDVRTGRAVLATDRAGRRGPCYAAADDALIFGLTARDVVDTAPALQNVRQQSVFDYLYGHVIRAPHTIYERVHRVGPAQFIEASASSLRARTYWRPEYCEDQPRPDFARCKAELRRLLAASVTEEMEGGHVGAFLSGGTDSSTLAGVITEVTGESAYTYSIGFDAEGFDEMAYARMAARHFKTVHREHYVTPQELVEWIPHVAAAYDQPFGNSSALPAFLCARLAVHDGRRRLLGGDGGDEIFGGNTRYALHKIFDAYPRYAPVVLRRALDAWTSAGIARNLPGWRKVRGYIEKANMPVPERLQAFNLLRRLGAAEMLTPEFLADIDREAASAEETAAYEASTTDALVNRMLSFDWKHTLSDNDLPKVVGSCDLAQIEVGFPFLNDGMVAFANALPAEWKVRRLRLRDFYKRALADFLPPEIIAKKKHGFGLPFGVWLTGHAGLRKLAFDSLDALVERGLLQRTFLENILRARLPEHPSYYGEIVWVLMMLEQWLAVHQPALRFSMPACANGRGRAAALAS